MTCLALAPAVHWRMFEGESEAVVYDAAKAQTHLLGHAAVQVLSLLRDAPRPMSGDTVASLLLGDEISDTAESQDDRSLLLALLHNMVQLRLIVELAC